MAFVHESLHLLLFLLSLSTCCLPSISTTYTTTTLAPSTSKPHKLVSKLIHYNSIHHPRYNPNETAGGKMKLDIEHLTARLAYFDGYKCKLFTYSVIYADNSFIGTVGSDTLVFETGDEGITRLTNNKHEALYVQNEKMKKLAYQKFNVVLH
jgi:hypothetical protein